MTLEQHLQKCRALQGLSEGCVGAMGSIDFCFYVGAAAMAEICAGGNALVADELKKMNVTLSAFAYRCSRCNKYGFPSAMSTADMCTECANAELHR